MSKPIPKITGILLAGGKSSRMDLDKGMGRNKGLGHDEGKVRDKEHVRDKGMIRLGKLLMYQYPLKVLESLCNEILISTCKPMEIEEEYEQVCDKIQGIGPIGGVVTCLEKSSNDLNIILSYDLPLVNRELFIGLLKYSGEPIWSAIDSSPNNDVITLKSDVNLTDEPLQADPAIKSDTYDVILPSASPGRPEPLCGIYRKSTIQVMQQMIDQEIFAMHKLIPRVSSKILPVGASDPFYHDQLFKNINSESDLSGLPNQLL